MAVIGYQLAPALMAETLNRDPLSTLSGHKRPIAVISQLKQHRVSGAIPGAHHINL